MVDRGGCTFVKKVGYRCSVAVVQAMTSRT
jgi:hypothetical protein